MAEPSEKDKFLSGLYEDLRYSAGKFDGQTLAISGAALGFSLSFIKDIVPFLDSIHSWLLYLSQGLFIFSILFGFISHYLSMRGTIDTIEKAVEEKYAEIIDANKSRNRIIKGLNLSIVIALPCGITLLVLYCFINIEHAKTEANASPSVKKITIEKQLIDGSNLLIEGEAKMIQFTDTTVAKTTIKVK